MEPKSFEVVTPSPYFKITFGCGNRAFYKDGYIDETCDYEGDLEEILIYNQERAELLIKKVLEFYGVPETDLPENMNVALTIY